MENRKRMKLGVLDLVPVFGGAQPGYALEQAARLAAVAESAGYERYWIAEHHDIEGIACTAPEVLLAHIGARTQRIRIGSGAVLLPHYKPIKVAEAFHTLAALYPGRIDLGLGRAPGGSAHVSMALSGNFLENVRLLPQTLRDLSDLLSGTFQMDGQPVRARPVPPVPPEVWILGTNRKGAAYAAEFGTGYVFGQFMSDQDGAEVISSYREAFRASPLLAKPRVIVAVGVVCADTEAEAERLVSGGTFLFRTESDEPAGIPAKNQKLLVGDPTGIKEQLETMRRNYGTDEFLVVTLLPDYEKRLRSYELLAQAIL